MAKVKQKTRTTHITAKTGKPPGMNYMDFLNFKAQIYAEAKEAAISEVQRVLGDRQAQRMAWMYIVALNERFEFEQERTAELEQAVKELSEEYRTLMDKHGQDYADEKLRERVSAIRGYEVQYLYEDQYPVNKEKAEVAEAEFVTVREAESRIY